ncbi:arginase [uncultured Peptoniphilus sp.]|uniref:arginase n=1 Tax=uncultured Peptoniphilus sp. TaxID=254354 RepID=UPI0028054C75|nr:arginase [uncultured Peptoniphilus sp.]
MNKNINIIGMPLDMGASIRGARLGPDAIRLTGLKKALEDLDYRVEDLGNVEVNPSYEEKIGPNNLKNFELVRNSNEKLFSLVDKTIKDKKLPLVLGGDHSLAIGSIKAALNNFENLGVIWIDTHGDINTEKISPSGNIHGMSLAALTGYACEELSSIGQDKNFLEAENLVYIGLRDLDREERMLLKEKNIKAFSLQEIDEYSIGKVTRDALNYLKKKTENIHISLDIDVVDPLFAPGTGTRKNGGLSPREIFLLTEIISKEKGITSVDLVEVNPLIDEKNKTAQLAVDILKSLFGEKLL